MSLNSSTSANELNRRDDADMIDRYIVRIVDNDKDALAELYHMTSASVYGFALSILKNTHDAEEALHDTYLRIYASSGGYKSMGKPLAWILTIARNLCLMKLRNRQKFSDIPTEDWNSAFNKLPSIMPEDRLVLIACMEKLSEEERQIVMLHAVSGFKHREIADFLSLPLSTVFSKYNRAIKKMRVSLTGGEFK